MVQQHCYVGGNKVMGEDFGKKSQFEFLYDSLAQKYPGLVNAGDGAFVFQFSQMPIAASWIRGTDENAYAISNSVPADLGGFYVPGDALDSAYSTLIKSIKPKNFDDNQTYRKRLIQVADLRNNMIKVRDDAYKDYYTWAANNQEPDGTASKTFDKWLGDPFGGSVWGDKLNDINAQVKEINNEMAAILKAMDAGLSDAIAALDTDTMPISRGGSAIQVPAVTINGDLANDKTRWDSYKDNEFDFEVEITKDSVIKYPWKTVYDTKVKQKCFNTSVETKVNVSRIITDAHYELSFKAVGLQGYQISRGKWYNSAFVDPNIELVEGVAGLTKDSFFGLNGSLHLIPETILVMYKPNIQLTISEEVYKQEFASKADADLDWIDLFSFRFEFDSIASLKPVKNANNTRTLTFESPLNASPQIIGITSKVAYNG